MRCDMDKLISTVTSDKLDKRTEVTFALKGKLPDCKRINTRDYLKVVNASNVAVDTVLEYNKFDIPENMFECGFPDTCVNTGTLALGAATNYAVFKLPYDGAKFSSGIITFYVKGFTGTKNYTFKISASADFDNADVYTDTVVGVAGEFTPVIIDLSATPSSVVGTGWNATKFVYIAINVDSADAVISSIAVFDSIDDFEINDVVKMRCLTTIEGDDAIDAAEATCANPNAKHDTSSPTFERTITGTAVTDNYQMLNPLVGKGEATKGFDIVTQTFPVVADGNWGVTTIPDAYLDECGYIQIASDCQLLKRYDLPKVVALDDDHFIVTRQSDGLTVIHFNKNLVGKDVTISYPREVTLEKEEVANIDNVDGVKVEMYVPYKMSNGKKRAKVYKNVLVTSFSDPRGEDDTEISVTLSIQKDESGHYYHIYYYE